MKYIITIGIIITFFNISFCQTEVKQNVLVSKKGRPILPAKGDFGIGINALPFLDFIGELIKINSASNFENPISFESPDGQQFFIKYSKSQSKALRAKINIAYHNEAVTFDVNNDITPGRTLVDKRVESYFSVKIAAGIEKRKGLGRIQGIFGWEVSTIFQNGSLGFMNYEYEYANRITSSNTAPSTALFINGTERPIYEKSPLGYGAGLNGIFGLEYFIAPKISIGGEMGLGFMFINYTSEKRKTEIWDATNNKVKVNNVELKRGHDINLAVNYNSNGILFLMFHF